MSEVLSAASVSARPARFEWNEKTEQFLRDAIRDGWSQTRTASELGVTRNTVGGKAFRLGLKFNSVPERKPLSARTRNSGHGLSARRIVHGSGTTTADHPTLHKTMKPGATPEIGSHVEVPPERRRTLETLNHNECRWPYGDPRQPEAFYFCGEVLSSADRDSQCPAYCTAHRSEALR